MNREHKRRLVGFAVLALLLCGIFAGLIPLSQGAILFENGFEEGNFSAWTGTAGTPQIVGTSPHHGSYCMLADGDGDYAFKTFTAGSNLFVRTYLNITAQPGSGDYTRFLGFYSGSTEILSFIYRNNAGTIECRVYNPTLGGVSAAFSLTLNTWICVELEFDTDADVHNLWIDDVLKVTLTGNIATNPDRVRVGRYSGFVWSFNAYYDCIVVANTYVGLEIEEENYPPSASNIGKNTTIAGNPCQLSTYWTTPTGNLSHWIVGLNNTGTWQNFTYAFTAGQTSAWSYYNFTLNSTYNLRIEWRIWANNTAGLWGDNGLQFFVTESVSPSYIDATYISEIRGVVIHEVIYGVSHNWNTIAETLAGYDVTAVFVNDCNGNAWRPNSEINAAITAFHAYGIEYHSVISVLNEWRNVGTEAITSGGSVWSVYTHCPIKAHDLILDTIENYLETFPDVDGIMLDYIRYGDSSDICYCSYCRAEFEQWLGEGTITNWTPFYPNQPRWSEYANWRNEPVTRLVKDIHGLVKSINPQLPISLASRTLLGGSAIYWRKWLGQDTGCWIKEGYLDFVAPMMYTKTIYGSTGETLQSYIDTCTTYWMGGTQEGPIPMVAQLRIDWSVDITPQEFKAQVDYVRSRGLDGWMVWRYSGPGGYISGGPDIRDYLGNLTWPTVFRLENITTAMSGTQATVKWDTDLAVTSKAEYSLSQLFTATWTSQSGFPYWRIYYNAGTIVSSSSNVTSHSLTLTDLIEGTNYYFRVQSTGESGIPTSLVFLLQRRPLYSNIGFNTTLAGSSSRLTCKWTTDRTLSVGIFSTNNTGIWQNSTVNLSGSQAWHNVTITLNSTVGVTVQFAWYANDSDNVWGFTGIFSLLTTSGGLDGLELIAPDEAQYWTYNQISFSFLVSFANPIINASLWLNASGTWQRIVWNTTTVVNATNNFVFNFATYPKAIYVWNIQVFNSTTGVFAPTNRTLIIDHYPKIISIAHTSETRDKPCDFQIEAYDSDGLSGYIIAHNSTGTPQNSTWQPFQTQYGNLTITLNATYGITIQYWAYINDTNNHWTASQIQSFTTTYIYWTFNFNHLDSESNTVDDYISWEVWNATELLDFTESKTLLPDGTYTLKTYYQNNLLNQTELNTELHGDSTVNITLAMIQQSYGYIAFNKTYDSFLITQQTSYILKFSASGSGLYTVVIDLPNKPIYVKKDGVNLTENEDWTYNLYVLIIETDGLSEWEILFTSYYITITITYPANTTYSTSTIPVSFSVSTNGTLQSRTYNVKYQGSWIYPTNQTYTAHTNMPYFWDGTFTFYAWATILEGESDEKTVNFSVQILPIGTVTINFSSNTQLKIQNDITHYLILKVVNGTWLGYNCYLQFWGRGGEFRFVADDNSTIQLTEISERTILTVNNIPVSPDGDFQILSGRTYHFRWIYAGYSAIDEYFVIGIGLFGLGLAIVCPVLAIRLIKEGDLDKVDTLGLLIVLTIIGGGMIIIWLW